MPELELQGQLIQYSLRQSQRAKRISLRFNVARGFQIVYPLRVNLPSAEEVFRQKQGWVLKMLKRQRALQNGKPFERSYTQGEEFLYLGEALQLDLIVKSEQKKLSIRRIEDRLEVSGAREKISDLCQVRALAQAFYRADAKAYLPPRVAELALLHGFHYGQIRIKNQKTRWGSCSRKRNLNFNMRLMMAPAAAIDSVILHELCHLRVMNHSAAFWDLLDQLCPDRRKWEKWLKENAQVLVF